MQSKATTVKQYLAELPADRRAAICAVREVILKNLDKDYEEGMLYGMICYFVPHSLYPDGYHCDPRQPLGFAALASQKNYMSLYMMPEYGDEQAAKRFQEAWAKTGKKLDMGKCCIRFKKVDDLALDVIADTIRREPAVKFIESYEAIRRALSERTTKGPPGKAAGKRSAGKTKPAKAKRLAATGINPAARSPGVKAKAAGKTARRAKT